ncbi:MAG: hypothetical protein ACT4N8_05170 [Sphingosinicella sp.]|uniref:hypothetical protein n=1 Tax=Sphingosinicella sp. TaxID=1917971 RepID=UPI004037EA24
MHFLLLAMMIQPQLQAVAEPPRRVARAERSRRLDLRSLDATLASEARRERRGRQSPQRIQAWRGVPVVMVDGRPHGIW